jgi:hypothetical protein
MATNVIIDYIFNGRRVSNPDGTFPATLPAGAQVVAGPGSFGGQSLPQAVKYGADGPLVTDVSAYFVAGTAQFHARVVFRWEDRSPVPGLAKHLLVCRSIPFSLEIVPNGTSGKLSATLTTSTNIPQSTQLFDAPLLQVDKWYTADLVYDKDTLVVLLDGVAISCHGFGPTAQVALGQLKTIEIGGFRGSTMGSAFIGAIAAVKVELGIPVGVRAEVDKQRTLPRWFITTKLEVTRPTTNLGAPKDRIVQTAGAHTQQYANGAISFTYGPLQVAYEMHGDMWTAYSALSSDIKSLLGYQKSDEYPFNQQNIRIGRNISFSDGDLSWSQATGVKANGGQIWKDKSADGATLRWGFATDNQSAIAGGIAQRFQLGTWYLKAGASHAFGIYDALDRSFRALGGIDKWGFPVANEAKVPGVMLRWLGQEIEVDVRKSELERATIFWSFLTGARLLSGPIRDKYLAMGGPAGVLGLPTTEEILDQSTTGRSQGFQRGVIRIEPQSNRVQTSRRFQIRLDSITTRKIGEKNDLYILIQVEKDGIVIFDHRYPDQAPGSYWGDQDSVTPNTVLPLLLTPTITAAFRVKVRVMDFDNNEDDLIGSGSTDLSMCDKYPCLLSHLRVYINSIVKLTHV